MMKKDNIDKEGIDYSKKSAVIEYPYTISKSIHGANQTGTFDLKGMSHGVFRFYCQMMFLCFFIGIVLGIIAYGYDVKEKKFALEYVLSGEADIRAEYQRSKELDAKADKDRFYYKPLESYEEYREGWLDMHGGFWNKFSVFYNGFFFELLLLSFVLAILFVPKPVPFRVDRAHNMLYTWRRGQLYAANLHLLFARTPAKANPYSALQNIIDGPYELELKNRHGEEKTFRIGSYPAQRHLQNVCIKRMIDAYATGEFDFPKDFTPTQHYLEKFSLRQSEFPSDGTLNAAINDWQQKQGKKKPDDFGVN